jgi:hypothetical protein
VSVEVGHAVTITFEQGDYWPTLRFTCQADEGSICHTVCSNSECEEGCYFVGQPGHERAPVDYCNTIEWFENADEVAGDIFGGPTSITAPILVDWSRGEDGPEWRLAISSSPGPDDLRCGNCDCQTGCQGVSDPPEAEADVVGRLR